MSEWRCGACLKGSTNLGVNDEVNNADVSVKSDSVRTSLKDDERSVKNDNNDRILNDVRNDGVRKKCGGCSQLVWLGNGVLCRVCGSVWHLKCAFATRGQVDHACRNN